MNQAWWGGKSRVSGGLRALSRCDTLPHEVEIPLRLIHLTRNWVYADFGGASQWDL